MIYDCILYNGEKNVLEVRLNELKGLSVTHVIVHSNVTFTGKPKPLEDVYFENCRSVFVDDMPMTGDAWGREKHQRNAIMRGIYDAKDNDIIIIGDVDEIPRASAIKSYNPKMGLTALKMDVFWYKFNCLAEKQTWTHPRIMPYSYLKNTTPNDVRSSGYENVIENAGWHFSYLGDEKFISNKLKSFSHTEYNTDEYTNHERLKEKIQKGESIWGDSKFEFLPLDESFPDFVVKNKERLKHLIA